MKLLDTTFLIDYLRGSEATGSYLEAHEDDELATTTINLKELAVGSHLAGDESKHDLLSRFGWLRVHPFSVDHAFRAGRLEADLRADDAITADRVDTLTGDILIAAVAAEHDGAVVTRNTTDFEQIGVETESY
jgi:predicted nucleic acid-binding protein